MNIANALRYDTDPERSRLIAEIENAEDREAERDAYHDLAEYDNARAALAAHDAAVNSGGWLAGTYAPDSSVPRVWNRQGSIVADAVTLADATRIAACVNACEGMDDPAAAIAAALNAQADPLAGALAYCETRDGEFWRRLAGSIRKARAMEGET